MKQESASDRRILLLMETDINAGLAAAFETYGGLVWSACARRLRDPEDIKECVNDTFLLFSAGYQKFEPEKGSLGNYLCTIALRRATDRYRKNLSVSTAEELYKSHMKHSVSLHRDTEELSAALDQLDPIDARILREKYYHGMTYHEIAASLGMSYETVKKRGQRNLKKLRFILIGLILALLAAGCAYLVYRSFQFAEGAGPNFDPGRPIYQLCSVEGEPYDLDQGTFFVENAIYQDGALYIRIGIVSSENWSEEEGLELMLRNGRFTTFCSMLHKMELLDEAHHQIIPESISYSDVHSYDGAGKGTIEKTAAWEPDPIDDMLTVQVILTREDMTTESLKKELLDTGIITESDLEKLMAAPPAWTITLKKVDFTDSDHTEGTFCDYLDTGFMVRDGFAYTNSTYVSLYPYQSETAYTLSEMLLHNYTGSYDDRCITLTAEDGTVYPARTVRGASASPLMERDIRFPQTPAGNYVLTIPYLCLITEDSTQTVTIPVPTELGQELPLEETVSFSDGSSICLTGIRYEQRTVDGFITGPNNEAIPQIMTEWDYVIECRLISEGTLLLTGAFGAGTMKLDESEETLIPWGSSIGSEQPDLRMTISQAMMDHAGYLEGAPYELTLSFSAPTYILDQEFQIPVTIHEVLQTPD